MNATNPTLTLSLTAALGTAGLAGDARAGGKPFAMQSLNSAYLVAAADDTSTTGKANNG